MILLTQCNVRDSLSIYNCHLLLFLKLSLWPLIRRWKDSFILSKFHSIQLDMVCTKVHSHNTHRILTIKSPFPMHAMVHIPLGQTRLSLPWFSCPWDRRGSVPEPNEQRRWKLFHSCWEILFKQLESSVEETQCARIGK